MTSFAAEWERLKQDAAVRAGAGVGAHGSGDVTSSGSAWTAAGNGVGRLEGGIARARRELEKGQEALGTGAVDAEGGGVESAAAQAAVFRSWDGYLEKVAGRVAELQEQLKKAGSDLRGDDKAVGRDFDRLGIAYEDTPATGGSGGGR
ncbi:hypothetical protein [Streptomyces sp. NPDC091212]|uniref:hypothetical protein n=1 Tax=Streptomyces sp. NPDC091212 TaxID=3155191 RepID=UPI003423B77F